MSNPSALNESNYILKVIPYIITLISGGAMGAFITRYFVLRDRKALKNSSLQPDYLILKTLKESVQSHKEVEFNGVKCENLIFKELILENKTTRDIENCEIIFEFDKDSVIVKEMTRSKKGLNAIPKNKNKSSEIIYELQHFNRTNHVKFEFYVAGFSKNFFSAVIDKCTGIELEFVAIEVVEQPSISPGTFISKEQLS